MKYLTKENKAFFIPSLIFILAGIIPYLFFNKATIHLYLNQQHHPFFDSFFKYMTWFGDGIIICLVGLIFIIVKFRYAIFIVVGYLSSGLFVQLLKRTVFSDIARPKTFFEGIAQLHFVEGVKVYGMRSFPSGHTTSAFAFFLGLALLSRNASIKFFMFVMALLVGYSRIYLSQHFLIDVVAGAIVGIFFAMLSYHYIFKINSTWMDQSVFNLKKNGS